jgi:hypothetical protein
MECSIVPLGQSEDYEKRKGRNPIASGRRRWVSDRQVAILPSAMLCLGSSARSFFGIRVGHVQERLAQLHGDDDNHPLASRS